MNTNRKLYSLTAIRNVVFSEIGIGISANIILLLSHILILLLQGRPKPTDLTVGHLALANTGMLLTMGFIATDIIGSQKNWDDIKCKTVIFTYRLMRGLSINTTCLLSVTQAITISPRSSCLAKFKQKSSWPNLYSLIFLWFFNMFTSARFLISTVASLNATSPELLFLTDSCSLSPLSYFFRDLFSTLSTFRDMFFIALMAFSSGYMVSLLCRHKKQTCHLHSTNFSPKTFPEERATKIILLIMVLFVITYIFDSMISFSLTFLWKNDLICLCFQMLMNHAYGTFSPLVLISTEKRIINALRIIVE